MELMEMFVVAAINQKNGKFYNASTYIKYGIAGLAIIALIQKGRISLEGEKVIVRDGTSTGNRIVDDVFAVINKAKAAKKLGSWIATGIPWGVKGLEKRVIFNLEDSGTIRIDEGRFLGLFPTKRYMVTNEAEKEKITERMKAALLGEPTTVDKDAAILVTLGYSCGFIQKYLSPEEKKAVKVKWKPIVKFTYFDFENEAIVKTIKAVTKTITNAKSASNYAM